MEELSSLVVHWTSSGRLRQAKQRSRALESQGGKLLRNQGPYLVRTDNVFRGNRLNDPHDSSIYPGNRASSFRSSSWLGRYQDSEDYSTMSLAEEIRSDVRAAKRIRLRWWAVLCLIAASGLISWLLDQLGKFEIALPAMNSVLVLAFVIAIKWDLRQQAWFWSTMAIIAALHAPLILFVPWTTRWVPGLVMGAIDSADVIAIFAILSVVRRLMEGPKTSRR